MLVEGRVALWFRRMLGGGRRARRCGGMLVASLLVGGTAGTTGQHWRQRREQGALRRQVIVDEVNLARRERRRHTSHRCGELRGDPATAIAESDVDDAPGVERNPHLSMVAGRDEY